jgi:RecB family exonuclease
LGHRLVEELHTAGVLADPARVPTEVDAWLDRLIREEAAVLLRPGMTFERTQLKRQLARSVAGLAELLAASGLVVDGVEATIVVPWGSRELEGRLDLLLRDAESRDVVLDLKWGASRYRELLTSGNAAQLAIYAGVRRLATGAADLPAAAYFSLSRGELLATETARFPTARTLQGPKLSETWTKLERTVHLVERTLARGDVPVTGVTRSLPLLEAANVSGPERNAHLDLGRGAACTYCDHSAICGRAWEGFG